MTAFLDTVARAMTYVVGTGIFVNVLDDAFIDARYFLGGLGNRQARRVDLEDLRDVQQQRIAIMLPAWREADVIEDMLQHNLSKIDYPSERYDIFCGTYQNDPETQARVDAAARRFGNVHKVVVPHDGPTSKADCLNWIHQGILLEEQRTNRRFEILLMHDAEDIIHPLSLRLYSLLIPDYEFVQTPVFSLPLPKSDFVSGTYIDEFAEHHLKDMLVREAIGGLVPSAGVGSAFGRDAFEEIATENGQQPFNVDSLTEDYEIGIKFRLANRRTHFACCTVVRGEGADAREEYIATREYFPSELGASVRQRSRWILGITMQTWQQIGWRGALPVLYCLWRDRKALVTNALLLCAYALLLFTAGYTFYAGATGEIWSFANVLSPDSAFTWILGTNVAFAGWRLAMKVNFVNRLYGPGHALLSGPRLFVGNAIGIAATARATYQYLSHRISGKPLRWLKTAHEFPTTERLATARRRLGEYLLDQRVISETDLDEALALQRESGVRLGDVLVATGVAAPGAVTEALAHQLDLRTMTTIDPEAIPPEALFDVPERLAEELDIVPVDERDGRIVIAASEQLSSERQAALREVTGRDVELRLAPRDEIRHAREHAYRGLVREAHARLSHALDESGEIITERAADRRVISQLGVAFCAFHHVLPVKALGDEPPRIFCAAPLHRAVRAMIVLRLGHVPVFETAIDPGALRVALAAVEGTLPCPLDEHEFFGLDASEWRAIKSELRGRLDFAAFVRETIDSERSPLEQLEQMRDVDANVVAHVRARVFGLRVSRAGKTAAGLLPPHLVAANEVTVLDQDGDSVDLAAPAPGPRLAREVAELLSPMKIAWSVAPKQRSA